MGREGERGGYTGRMYEVDMFGEVANPEQLAKEIAALPRFSTKAAYEDAVLEVIKRYQPAEPTAPTKELARELRLEVADSLGLKVDDWDRVKFYTTVKSTADLWGIDGFIVFEDPASGREFKVTIDLTKNPQKLEDEKYGEGKYGPDIVVGELPDPMFQEDAYREEVDAVSHRIAVLLQRRASEDPRPRLRPQA